MRVEPNDQRLGDHVLLGMSDEASGTRGIGGAIVMSPTEWFGVLRVIGGHQ